MARYLVGLGYLGLKDKGKAKEELTKALETILDLLGARTALPALKQDRSLLLLLDCNRFPGS